MSAGEQQSRFLESDRSLRSRVGVYANRTLNLRSIRAVGFDMDYTLVHYDVAAWEGRAFSFVRDELASLGWPVEGLHFSVEQCIRGLVVDTELGNIVKPDSHGYVIRAAHGTEMLSFPDQRAQYGTTTVALADERWVFMNTLFSLSAASLYAQLVDLRDAGALPEQLSYRELYGVVEAAVGRAHIEGRLKAEIIADPARFVVRDPALVPALRDLRDAGKRLMVITNSEWPYTEAMMSYAFDPYLNGACWRDLFELVVVAARKPEFFLRRNPAFEVVDEARGLLRPTVDTFAKGRVYQGGDAHSVEEYLGLAGAEILYCGDHVHADVRVSKGALRWRTMLVLRELERDITASEDFEAQASRLRTLMARKAELEAEHARSCLGLQRLRHGDASLSDGRESQLDESLSTIKQALRTLDAEIAPLAAQSAALANPAWGLLMRAGNTKSHLARQLERHADIYSSRVSGLLSVTPYAYLRAPRRLLPHELSERVQDLSSLPELP